MTALLRFPAILFLILSISTFASSSVLTIYFPISKNHLDLKKKLTS